MGTATVTIKGKGRCSGTITKTFEIAPKGTKYSSVKRDGNKITAIWIKQTVQTTGYQIMYSSSPTFKSGNKTVAVKGSNRNSLTINNLASNKKFYFRIRTYKTVNGKNYYSAWS